MQLGSPTIGQSLGIPPPKSMDAAYWITIRLTGSLFVCSLFWIQTNRAHMPFGPSVHSKFQACFASWD